jgi:hypothetical protein
VVEDACGVGDARAMDDRPRRGRLRLPGRKGNVADIAEMSTGSKTVRAD